MGRRIGIEREYNEVGLFYSCGEFEAPLITKRNRTGALPCTEVSQIESQWKWMKLFSVPKWVIVCACSSTGGSLTHSKKLNCDSFEQRFTSPSPNSQPPPLWQQVGGRHGNSELSVECVLMRAWFEMLELHRNRVCVCVVYPWLMRAFMRARVCVLVMCV